jgi:hypothetical protein
MPREQKWRFEYKKKQLKKITKKQVKLKYQNQSKQQTLV